MAEPKIYTLDLNFMGMPGAIASYLIPHAHGAVLVESGPGSTIPALISGLKIHGFAPTDLTDVFLTHIHLDHAGAAGWLAGQGARIHVHPLGAAHLVNPEKLLSSAARIYGEMMEPLWGEFLPVPPDRLSVEEDGQITEIEDLRFKAVDTPGHAEHHHTYVLGQVCFSGDIGGIRLGGLCHLRLPMPPPEFNLEKWRRSLERLRQEDFAVIAPTHFGLYYDPEWHLAELENSLHEVEAWMQATLPSDPPVEQINAQFLDWTRRRSFRDGLNESQISLYEAANPSSMSGYGMQRYWKKYRQGILSKTSDRLPSAWSQVQGGVHSRPCG